MTEPTDRDLQPCPYCGHEAFAPYSVKGEDEAHTRCAGDQPCAGRAIGLPVSYWNRRAASRPPEATPTAEDDLCSTCQKARGVHDLESSELLCDACYIERCSAVVERLERDFKELPEAHVQAVERQRIPLDDEISTAYNEGITDAITQLRHVALKLSQPDQEARKIRDSLRPPEATPTAWITKLKKDGTWLHVGDRAPSDWIAGNSVGFEIVPLYSHPAAPPWEPREGWRAAIGAVPDTTGEAPETTIRRMRDEEPREDTAQVTRFEVIDHRTNTLLDKQGRLLVVHGCAISLSYQDAGRTLKVFLDDADRTGAAHAHE